MFIIKRKIGEKLQIGEDITIAFDIVNGTTIKLAIDAPADVKIQRHETIQDKDDAAFQTEAYLAAQEQEKTRH